MENFTFCNPTKIYFGRGALENLEAELPAYERNVLLAYGSNSLKKSGLYDQLKEILSGARKNVFELSGIMPNPRREKVNEGVKICKAEGIDLIIAAGGGSVIDCAKMVAAGAMTGRDFWQSYMVGKDECRSALPIGAVLTVPGTGSEMNGTAVISDWQAKVKTGYHSPALHPAFSILDPVYSYTLSREQTVYGAIDAISHLLEGYFSMPDVPNPGDAMSEALIKTIMENLRVAVQNPRDYTARANLMWCSTLALNGITQAGKEGDWESHQIEHAMSAYYDIPHGAGLAVAHPAYLKYILKAAPRKFAAFAANVFGVDVFGRNPDEAGAEGIERLKAFFKEMGAPVTLAEAGIPKEAVPVMARSINLYGSYIKLTRQDIEFILYSAV